MLLLPCAAQAGETITYPGNGVLGDVIMDMYSFSNSLAPSASSPSGNTVTVTGGSIGSAVNGTGNVFGGYSTQADVSNNTVRISGGSVGAGAYGGFSETGNAVGNSVTISGGTFGGAVYGGSSSNGNAVGNRVVISGGTIGGAKERSGFVYGGDGASSATGNSVVISGGTIGGAGQDSGMVRGGVSRNGNAVGNSVTISGGTIGGTGSDSGRVIGGYSLNGNATGNSVVISGGTIGGTGSDSGRVIGGYSLNGNATHNTVTILGNPVFGPHAELLGGEGNIGADLRTGNTLNIFTSGITVKNINNFQHYNFAFSPTSGATLLTLTAGSAALFVSGDVVRVRGVQSGHKLNVGHQNTLISVATPITSLTTAMLPAGQARQGIALTYDYTLSLDNPANVTKITATVTGVQVAPESKAVTESRAASMGFVNVGADLVAGAGLANARAATTGMGGVATAGTASGLSGGDNSNSWGLAPFFALSASSLRYNTGSHSDVSGTALMAGLAKTWHTPAADLLAGAFFEAGFGRYKTHNTFSTGSADGQGDTKSVGGGILARVDLTDTMLKGLYAEASFRIGSLTSDYSSSDLRDFMGNTARYDSQSTYYGAHAGLGYIWNFNENASLDLYGKYFWTHQTGQDVTILGDKFSFKDADSQRVKLGGRFSYAVAETLTPYIGAAWEYEFDGEARATTYGFDVPAPSLKGSTGVGEIGLLWKPEKAQGFSVDLGLQGYTGMREGVSGSLQLKYEF